MYASTNLLFIFFPAPQDSSGNNTLTEQHQVMKHHCASQPSIQNNSLFNTAGSLAYCNWSPYQGPVNSIARALLANIQQLAVQGQIQ